MKTLSQLDELEAEARRHFKKTGRNLFCQFFKIRR